MTTPTISGVTGLVQTGQELTIAGSDFYNQDRTDLDLTAAVTNMEGETATADGWVNGADDEEYSPTIKIWKGGSAVGKRHTGPGQFTQIIYNSSLSGAAATRYIRWMLYLDASVGDGTWPDNYWKLWYNASSAGNSFLLNFLQTGRGAESDGPPTKVAFIDQDTGSGGSSAGENIAVGTIPNGGIQNGKWNSFVIGVPQGSPHLWECWVNGEKIIDFNYNISAISSTNNDSEFDTNADGNIGAGLAIDTFWGMIEHSSSRLYDPTIVHIGNTNNFATASPKYQHLTQISNIENKVVVDLNGLGDGPYWMWVTNARNERSDAYSLSGDNPDRSDPARMFRSLGRPRHSIFR